MQNFQHPCFANLTHLHLYDEMEDRSTYVGFENLRSLTHLALACCGPEELAIVMPKLPAIEYVALCHYKTDESVPSVNRRVPVEVCGVRVVWIDGLTINDWERGATGGADFWDLVEREVGRRRAKMVRVIDTVNNVIDNCRPLEIPFILFLLITSSVMHMLSPTIHSYSAAFFLKCVSIQYASLQLCTQSRPSLLSPVTVCYTVVYDSLDGKLTSGSDSPRKTNHYCTLHDLAVRRYSE
jgi:hypothetical protein